MERGGAGRSRSGGGRVAPNPMPCQSHQDHAACRANASLAPPQRAPQPQPSPSSPPDSTGTELGGLLVGWGGVGGVSSLSSCGFQATDHPPSGGVSGPVNGHLSTRLIRLIGRTGIWLCPLSAASPVTRALNLLAHEEGLVDSALLVPRRGYNPRSDSNVRVGPTFSRCSPPDANSLG